MKKICGNSRLEKLYRPSEGFFIWSLMALSGAKRFICEFDLFLSFILRYKVIFSFRTKYEKTNLFAFSYAFLNDLFF
jgi:hypothetical protein